MIITLSVCALLGSEAFWYPWDLREESMRCMNQWPASGARCAELVHAPSRADQTREKSSRRLSM